MGLDDYHCSFLLQEDQSLFPAFVSMLNPESSIPYLPVICKCLLVWLDCTPLCEQAWRGKTSYVQADSFLLTRIYCILHTFYFKPVDPVLLSTRIATMWSLCGQITPLFRSDLLYGVCSAVFLDLLDSMCTLSAIRDNFIDSYDLCLFEVMYRFYWWETSINHVVQTFSITHDNNELVGNVDN